jgi:hypothetical protein
MKKLLAVTAVLLMVGPVMAAPTMTLTTDKPAADITAGATLNVILSIQTDVPLVSWNAKVNGPAGVAIAPFTTAAYQTAAGWDNAAASCIAWSNSSFPMTTPSGGLVGTLALSTATSGPALIIPVTLPAGAKVGDLFTFSVSGGTAANESYEDLAIDNVAPLTLSVVPEPVSALLLLAGLPMLRRRR